MIWALAERYLRGTGEDIEDAVQEVFVEVWKSAPRFDPAGGSEPAFIATIAHRRLIDRQRRLRARGGTKPQLDTEYTVESKPARIDTAALKDDLRTAAAAFESLANDEKEVLWYVLYHGLSHERIAKATDLPVGTVKSRIRRGLATLREALSGGSAAERGQR